MSEFRRRPSPHQQLQRDHHTARGDTWLATIQRHPPPVNDNHKLCYWTSHTQRSSSRQGQHIPPGNSSPPKHLLAPYPLSHPEDSLLPMLVSIKFASPAKKSTPPAQTMLKLWKIDDGNFAWEPIYSTLQGLTIHTSILQHNFSKMFFF